MTLPTLHIHPLGNLHRLSAKILIILGSASPRRKDLLQRAKISFSIVTTDVPEEITAGELPDIAAMRLAELKARKVVERLNRENINDQNRKAYVVIAADTIVWHESKCLGKPENPAKARELLCSLRGKTHQVFTAVSMLMRLPSGEECVETSFAVTKVSFNQVSDDEIERYIATDDPLDKAGAYGAQELGAFLVDQIEGELDTVIGFPLAVVDDLSRLLLDNLDKLSGN